MLTVPPGKHALVTGGLGTIGRAIVAALADAGVRVTVLDRPGAEPLAGHGFLGVDLNDLAAIEDQVGAFVAENPVDILINNAAWIINQPHETFSIAEYEDQIRINSSAAFILSRVCSPHMKAQGWGRIVNLTSITMNGQWDGYVPYVASKAALHGLTKGLARELGPHGITVNAVAPGAVLSGTENRVYGDRLQEYNDFILTHQSVKKRIEAVDIAALALFLCTDGARLISGQDIGVDGGW
jgi:NAD(P)-dependent dehydrogenase (short-subunit alcohol dehydrogenase family)